MHDPYFDQHHFQILIRCSSVCLMPKCRVLVQKIPSIPSITFYVPASIGWGIVIGANGDLKLGTQPEVFRVPQYKIGGP